jgi:hypothetical protein
MKAGRSFRPGENFQPTWLKETKGGEDQTNQYGGEDSYKDDYHYAQKAIENLSAQG